MQREGGGGRRIEKSPLEKHQTLASKKNRASDTICVYQKEKNKEKKNMARKRAVRIHKEEEDD